MQVSAPAGQHLTDVDLDPCAVGDHAKQQSLLIPRPAPYARTYRGGHQNRLTPPGGRSIPSHLRLPSLEDWRVLMGPILHTFAS
jgi:hypothetical protein